jgi:hypothetical protein
MIDSDSRAGREQSGGGILCLGEDRPLALYAQLLSTRCRAVSSQGELKPVKRQSGVAEAVHTQPGMVPRQMPGPQTEGQKGKVLGV